MMIHRRTLGLEIMVLTPLLCLIGLLVPFSPPVRSQTLPDPVFVGAGDIAECDTAYDEATAKLLDVISGTIYTIGDTVYSDGTPQEFTDCFGPTWGRHRARIKPVPGNHDYHTPGAAGYYGYFGAAASPLDANCTHDCKGYYSYELGAWHIIALNSEIAVGAGSEQEQWLRQDLAVHPAPCTLAYWHKPRFSSGEHGNNTSYHALWAALYEYGADVILNGHDHDYERFAPQNPLGEADARGIRQFVVGTGGTDQRPFAQIQPNSEVRATDSWGVLQFTLHERSYDWTFMPVAGQSFHDAGSSDCVAPDRATTILERRVAQSSDDAEEGSPTAPVYLDSSDLELTFDPDIAQTNQTVGVRFTQVRIPRQVTVTRAYLEFVIDEVSVETTTLQISGAATANAPPFATTPADLSQRRHTAAAVAWSVVPAWTTVGAVVRTPDLTPLVQELINHPDWNAGNALAFLIQGTGRRTAVAFDGNPQAAPLLHIEYTGTGRFPAEDVYMSYLPLIEQSALARKE